MTATMNNDVSGSPQLQAGRWAAALVLFLATFMNLMDVTIVNVALPAIQTDFSASSTQLEWVAAVYLLAFAAGLLPFGRFGDVFGRKRMFVAGIAGFTVASALCGLAADITFLIAMRAIQGLAGAMMVPQVLAIIHVIFPPAEKGKVFGLFGAITSLGAVAGPVLGGALISADILGLGWRPIFLINLPLGAAALIGAVYLVPNISSHHNMRPDWRGMALFASAIILIVLPLIEGRNFGWPWWCFASMGLSLPLAYYFWQTQKQRAVAKQAELLPAHLLINRDFVSGIAKVTLFFSAIPGVFLIIAIYFQTGFGLTALQSGLATVPFPAGVLCAMVLNGRLSARSLNSRVAVGSALLLVGMIFLRQTIVGTDDGLRAISFIPPLLIAGFGMGIAIAALFQSVLESVSPQDAGAGSGTLQAFQQIGTVLGIAIVGQLFFATLEHDMAAGDMELNHAFVDAAATAIWYPVAAFACLTASLVWAAIRQGKAEI